MDKPVDLNRRFICWSDDQQSDPDLLRSLDAIGSSLDWSDLLEKRRVVILAEAGSGKSTELARQAELLTESGGTTFLVTLQNIGRKGSVERAIGRAAWAVFEKWKASDTHAWLFLDSVDEAKNADFAFPDVLDSIAEAIDGVGGRMHLILSGRHSDWEFKRDLASLLERVPIPPPDRPPVTATPDEALIAALHCEKREVPANPERPLIVVMAGLDRPRVETFATAKGVVDVGRMVAQLEKQNLSSFARRPVDLDWLVNYWRVHDAFGPLAEMLELSLVERLKETNTARVRGDALSVEHAMTALERIGASLVLQRLDTLVVPDATLDLRDDIPALSLTEVLPDWSSAARTGLLMRPVFDPATPGFVRIHNDNDGAVRGYLAARWLHRLRTKGNCPRSRLFALLFAETYGVRLVKPSMRATAAWLSLWDGEVAQEVVKREPRLLMDAGDPGSLSLDARVKALDAIIALIEHDDLFEIPDHDAVKRFAKADLGPFVLDRWALHHESPSVRTLLMLLVWLGGITTCASIALKAATGDFVDRYTQVFGGRATALIGSESDKRTYVEHLVANSTTVPAIIVWDALDLLFPEHVSIAEMLLLVDNARSRKDEGGLGIDHYGPKLAQRLRDAESAAVLVEAILARLAVGVELDDLGAGDKDDSLLETLEVAAIKLLEFSPSEETSTLTIDAALRIGGSRRFRGTRKQRQGTSLADNLRATPARRRAALWHTVEVLRARKSRLAPIVDPWQLRFLGFHPGFESADLEWLLDDLQSKIVADDIRFATNAALAIWKQGGECPAELDAIKIAATSPIASAALVRWFTPKTASEEEQQYEREQQAYDEQGTVEKAKVDASWIEFASALRANPDQLRTLPPPTEAGTDSRLFHLWQLLDGIGENRDQYAIRDLSPIRQLFGDAVADALRDAFVRYWRHVVPTLAVERPPEERNSVRSTDMIAIVGITQEALGDSNWASKLDTEEAKLATRFATIEMNGFPFWLDDLAKSHPNSVGAILWIYVAENLTPQNDDPYPRALLNVASSSDAVVATIAERMLLYLETHFDAPFAIAEAGLRIVRRGLLKEQLTNMALDRFNSELNRHQRAVYLAALFAENPEKAIEALVRAVELLPEPDQVALVQAVLPRIFGDRSSRNRDRSIGIPFSSLERLVVLAFSKIHPDSDNNHPSGRAYSPDERDHAEEARGMLFRELVNTPGFATYAALNRLFADPDFPMLRRRMANLLRDRAGADSESAPWRSQDVRAFEVDFETLPATSADLQRVGVARLDEIEHDLLHGDFNQGLVVARLPHEVDVQNWIANSLRATQGRSYSLEREPHVADEKEPDIRLQSRIADARAPIEIKVAESCSLTQLEAALIVQLKGRYLRDRNNRFGILLIVHQKARPMGWSSPTGFLTYGEVIAHLRRIAQSMGAVDALAPQMVVCSIDLSNIARST